MALSSSQWRFVVVGALLVAAIIGATGLIIYTQRAASIEAYRTATNNLGVGMARQTARSLGLVDRALQDLNNLFASPPNATPELIAAGMRDDKTSTVLLDESARAPGVESIALIDRRGGIANSSSGSPSSIQIVDQQLFAYFAANDDATVSVGRPVQVASSGEWTATMARRINSADGNFAGIVLAVLSLRELEDFYKVAMPPNRSVSVARRDGVILVQYPPIANAVGAIVPNLAQWGTAVASGGGTYVFEGRSGQEPLVASVNPLPDLPFVVEATVLERYALADWDRQRPFVILGGASAVVTVLLLLWLFAAQYQRIRAQHDRIQASEGVLTEKNRQLDATRGQLHAALSNLSQGVCFFNGDQKLLVANDRFADIYGLASEMIQPGTSLAEIGKGRVVAGSASASLRDEYLDSLGALAETNDPSHFIIELENGRTISIRHQPMPGGGWIATHEDVTERRAAETKIAFLATHDVLTGLANRALLQERMERAQIAARRGESFAVLFLDLDGFKAVNTSVGHQGGDELLHAVAKRLVACVREGDTVARTGGDEFVILLQNPTEAANAAHLAGRIIQKLAEAFQIDGRQVSVGVSIGIAVAPKDGTSVEALTRCADSALYVAKAEGRGKFRFFEAQIDESDKSYA